MTLKQAEKKVELLTAKKDKQEAELKATKEALAAARLAQSEAKKAEKEKAKPAKKPAAG